MHIRRFGLLSTLFPMLVLAPIASAGGPVSPFPWSGAPRAQSVPVGNDGLATDDTDVLSGSVAVIPFTNISGNAADDWIGDGIAETVMADLESLAELRVIARERLRAVSGGRRGAEGASGPGGLGPGTVTGGIILPDSDPVGRSGPGGRGGPGGRPRAGAPAVRGRWPRPASSPVARA